MRRITLFLGFVTALLLISCNSDVDMKEGEVVKRIEDIDTTTQNEIQDTSISEVNALVVDMSSAIDKDGYVDVEKEHLQSISKKTPQLDFCTCIVRIDSMEKELNVLEGEQWDKLWADYEVLTEKCKVVLAIDDSPEGRKKHERKVKKCLK